MTSPMHNMIVSTIHGSINIFFLCNDYYYYCYYYGCWSPLTMKIPANNIDDINTVMSRLMMTMIFTGKNSYFRFYFLFLVLSRTFRLLTDSLGQEIDDDCLYSDVVRQYYDYGEYGDHLKTKTVFSFHIRHCSRSTQTEFPNSSARTRRPL